jgi:type IV pilus assembly protein PilA
MRVGIFRFTEGDIEGMKKAHHGFTMIELLVVIAIIGILAAIAVPQFSHYQKRAADTAARQDLKNAAVAQEAYFVEHNTYVNCDTKTCPATLPGLKNLNPGTSLSMTGDAKGFTGTASHAKGSGTYSWNSTAGGLQ